jgi:hypothetical protein
MVALSATLALAALSAAACGGTDTQHSAGAPSREIQLAPVPPAEPQLNDAPAKTASAPKKAPAAPREEQQPAPPPLHVQVSHIEPRAVAPAPAPAPVSAAAAAPAAAGPAPVPLGTVDAGTSFVVRTAVRICTSSHKAGDRFSTTLGEAIVGSNGAVIPAGSPVVFRIVESSKSENTKDSIRLVFDVVSVRVGDESYQVDAHVAQTAQLEKVRVQSTGDQAKKVAEGAAIGAILGRVLGKNTKSTVAGAVVGAAAGGAVAAGTADYDGCVAQSTPISFTLNRPLTIKVGTRGPGL